MDVGRGGAQGATSGFRGEIEAREEGREERGAREPPRYPRDLTPCRINTDSFVCRKSSCSP